MIKLLVADGHPVVREGLRRIVNECPDMMVVAEAADGNGLLAALGAADVDVVLLDIAMPGPGFLDVLAQLRSQHPKLAVLILSVYSEEQYTVRAIKAGAAGYLMKDSSPDRLAEAIRRAARRGKYISSSLARVCRIN